MTPKRFAWIVLFLAAPGWSESARELLEARSRRDSGAVERSPTLLSIPPGQILFWMDGPDNGVAVTSVPDVNADGRAEVLLGIDESGVDNVFLLDGASSGAASALWSFETPEGVSGGSPYGDQCLVPVGDTNGNGAAEVLVGTAWGGRTAYALDADAGGVLWSYDTYDFPPESGWVYSLAQLSDTSGNGIPEVAFGAGSFSDSLYVVEGGSSGVGALLWRWQASDGVVSVRNAGDLDGDGASDPVIAVGDTGDAIVALDGNPPTSAGATLWSYPTGGPSAYAVGVLKDVTGDGTREVLAVLWTTNGSAVRALNGTSGALVWASTSVFEYGMQVDLLSDVTGDGLDDVLVSSWENAAQLLDGATGAPVWKRVVGTENGGDVWSARATGDLNGDGASDVLAGSFDGHVYALSGRNGVPFWAYDTGNRVFSVHGLGDLNGDGVPEAGAATQDTTSSRVLHVLDGDAGLVLALFADDFENGAAVGWADVTP